MIRGLLPNDWPWVLALNTANQTETGPLDDAKLAHMCRESCLALAYGEADAFLIAFDRESDYDSPNFRWFRERYRAFVYVDRIVVRPEARGRGIARALYEHAIVEGRAARYGALVCEVNYDPPNPASDAFHARLGFREAGMARLENGKGVRYLIRDL